MSANDLRSSLRAALSFQPTYRTRKTTHQLPAPYLDRVSVTEHRGSPKSATIRTNNKRLPNSSSHKHLIIRPIGVPDLKHTKLQTCFAPEDVPFTAPTGKILKGFRTTLQRGYIDAVKSVNAQAAAARKARMEQEQREEEPEYYDEDEDDRYEREDHGGRRVGDREEGEEGEGLFDRQKFEETMAYEALDDKGAVAEVKDVGYSAPPKFEAFLDFVYGPSNLNGIYSRSHNDQMKEYLPVPRK